MMLFEATSYRKYLKSVLEKRKANRREYSLRAFARDLGLSSSLLSDVMLMKCNLSMVMLESVAQKLKLEEREQEFFLTLGRLEREKTKRGRFELNERLSVIRSNARLPTNIDDSDFTQMADWTHSALLQLPQLENFQLSKETAAKALEIPVNIAAKAIEKLARLQLLVRSADNRWTRRDPVVAYKPPFHTASINKFYKSMIQRLVLMIEKNDADQERWSGYSTMSVNREGMKEIGKLCERFVREASTIAEEQPGKDCVAHLMVHFFELTNGKVDPASAAY